MVLPSSLFHMPMTAAVAGALFASLWQGSLLVLFVALGLRLLPGLTAAARAAIWVVVLVVITTHPVLAFSRRGTGVSSGRLVHANFGFSVALVGIWAMASLFRLFQLLISGVELWRTLRLARPLGAPPAVAASLRASSRRPELCASELVNRPCVAGFLRPRLLLPADLLPVLKESELAHIVLHELEHLRRGDDWVNLLQQIALVILPLHPAMFWVNKQVALERELACDDAVLATTRAGKAYAACLAHVAEQSMLRRGLSLAVGALGRRRSELTARVERILRRPERTLSGMPLRLATGLVLAATVFAGGALDHSPTLVSFGPETPSATSALMDPLPGDRMLPVVSRVTAREGVGEPHAALLKAVMPVSRAASHLRSLQSSPELRRTRRATALKAGLRRRGRGVAAPWLVLTSWQEVSPERGASGAERSEQRFVPALYVPRVVPVMIETQQIWYSSVRAVETPDGWLVVQL